MVDAVRLVQFASLSQHSVPHAIFQRHGGVSPAPWHSLNLGGGLGDSTERVKTNRDRALEKAARLPNSVYDVWQVHSATAVRATQPRAGKEAIQADVIVTNNPEITLLMRFADCVPVLIYDPEHNAVGIAHAGWLGTVRGVSTMLVQTMAAEFGSVPNQLIAGIGPSIGPCHYEVGQDVINLVQETFGLEAGALLQRRKSSIIFDLWAANRYQLQRAGLEQIEISEICTACENEDWFSHRAEQGRTGRFGAVIACKA